MSNYLIILPKKWGLGLLAPFKQDQRNNPDSAKRKASRKFHQWADEDAEALCGAPDGRYGRRSAASGEDCVMSHSTHPSM